MTPDHPDLAETARPTDTIQVSFGIVANSNLSITSFTANFRAGINNGRNSLNPRRLHLLPLKKAGFVEKWAQLEPYY